jgi:hypothetical protein
LLFVARMTGEHHCAYLVTKMESRSHLPNSLVGLPLLQSLISASQIARIIGMSHWCLPSISLLI